VDKTTFLKYFPLPGMMGERLFSVFDRDNSGAIDFQEFLTGMGLIYRGTLEEKRRFLFEMYDLDDDGVVTREELFTMLSHIPSAFKILDASMEGARGHSIELREDPQTISRIRNIVDSAFENKKEDENLTFEEFTRVVNKTPEILEIINVFYDEALPEHDFACRHSKITDGPLPRLSIWSSAQGVGTVSRGLQVNHTPQSNQRMRSMDEVPTFFETLITKGLATMHQARISGVTSREETDSPRAHSELSGDDNTPNTPSSSLSSGYPHLHMDNNSHHAQPTFCPMCHAQVGLQHCVKCGTMLTTNCNGKELSCDECGWELETVRFCFRCGQPLKRMLFNTPSTQDGILNNISTWTGGATIMNGPPPSTSSSDVPSTHSTPVQQHSFTPGRRLSSSSFSDDVPQNGITPANIARGRPEAVQGCIKCVLCGEMTKLGRNTKIVRTRYFVLKDRFLHYYRSRHDALQTEAGGTTITPKGSIFLEGAYIRAIPEDPLGLEIRNLTTTRTYFLKETEERDKWVEALARATKNNDVIADYYQLSEFELGRGKFAVVYQAQRKKDQKEVAVKVICKKDLSEESREFIRTEIAILKMVHHENLVTMVDMFDEKDRLSLVMERVSGGDLLRRLLSLKDNHVSEDTARTIMFNLVSAVRFMHEHGIIHRDLKPENVLIVDPPEPFDLADIRMVKVTDFGLSAITQNRMDTPLGTVAYAAPEILRNQIYDKQVDMWSLGAIAFIVIGGQLPFRGKTKKEIAHATMKVDYSYNHSPVWQSVSNEAKQFVDALLRLKPSERLTAVQLFKHPWLIPKHTNLKR